ncbi:MAG TPA: PH domain-containing protein [Vicinamibacterales bacterium]|nr:PH domain-containing protein [Vicinamibacterales bacterium]
MPSEQHLHPASILFGLIAQLREFGIPLVFALVAGSRGGLEAIAPLALTLYTLVAVLRYYYYRYRFEEHELVVKHGFFVRNERHIPFARIQNLDAIQNVLHRLLGVVDVRVDTGSGAETDARLSVVTWDAYREMRERVFAGRRTAPATAAEGETDPAAPAELDTPRVLLALPTRELAIHGVIENRGGIVIAGLIGLLWEAGVTERVINRVAGDDVVESGRIRDAIGELWVGGVTLERLGLVVAAIAGVLILIRLLSVVLAIIRLHGFRVSRAGEDLRAEYGLITRVSATIPLRRIQTLTVTDGILHRLFDRVTIRVDTAGGSGPDGGERRRESLAPVIAGTRSEALIREVLPELDLSALAWQAPAEGALTRELRRRLITSAVVAGLAALAIGWYALSLFGLLVAWHSVAAGRTVAHLGWAVVDGAVLFRSGWLRRHLTIARYTRVQSVELVESPFDRRWAMARVSVDTAGAGAASHRVAIPYLTRPAAVALHASLSAAAARTAFHW